MKVAVKGGAAVDPESGTIASVEFLRKQCRNSFKPLFHWTPLCLSSFVLWTDLIVNFVCFIVFRAAASLSVVHHFTTDLLSVTLVPMRLVPLSS